jgi:hypothetical protein
MKELAVLQAKMDANVAKIDAGLAEDIDQL